MFRLAIRLALAMVITGCGAASPSIHVEVLASIRHSASGSAWNVEAESYRGICTALLGRNDIRIVITPISDRSLTEASLFDEISPGESLFGKNDYDASRERKSLARKAEDVLATLLSRRSGSPRTEIINAIVGVADRFAAAPHDASRLLVIVSTAFEQSSILNMADYHLNLNSGAIRRRVLEHLKATGQLVNLRGVDVCMLAITNGDHNWADYNRSRGVRRLWRDYFAAAGARLMGYGAAIGSCQPLANGGGQ
jgi:hypothetical protein